MGRFARAPLLALALLLGAGVSAGADEPPVFLIERVVVEGLERESARQIVLSESLLEEGGTYSEPQLRDAVYRVKRLPFVVDADMTLRKGSERGAYELVIMVEAAKPVAFAVDLGGIYSAAEFDDEDPVDFGASFTVSARKFLGARGLLFGSAQAFDDDLGIGTFQLGYTRYGLFRTGGYATAAVSRAVGDDDVGENLQASVQLGIPVVGNHAVRAGATWTSVENRFRFYPGFFETRFERWRGDVEWIYDSTDDPLFATTGRRVTTTGGYELARQSFRTVDDMGDGPIELNERSEERAWLVATQGRQYWSITPKQSLGVGGGASHSESFELSGAFTAVNVEAIHAFNVWDFAVRERRGDLRLETVARLTSSRSSSEYFDYDSTDALLETSLLFRNAWGIFRLRLLYYDNLGGDY